MPSTVSVLITVFDMQQVVVPVISMGFAAWTGTTRSKAIGSKSNALVILILISSPQLLLGARNRLNPSPSAMF
jgi:hypothetical protein